MHAQNIPAQPRRRRDAALRLPPLDHGHRDPLDRLTTPVGPATFGLTPAELVAEAHRLRAEGWSACEVAVRLARPELAVAHVGGGAA